MACSCAFGCTGRSAEEQLRLLCWPGCAHPWDGSGVYMDGEEQGQGQAACVHGLASTGCWLYGLGHST